MIPITYKNFTSCSILTAMSSLAKTLIQEIKESYQDFQIQAKSADSAVDETSLICIVMDDFISLVARLTIPTELSIESLIEVVPLNPDQ